MLIVPQAIKTNFGHILIIAGVRYSTILDSLFGFFTYYGHLEVFHIPLNGHACLQKSVLRHETQRSCVIMIKDMSIYTISAAILDVVLLLTSAVIPMM